MRAVRLVPIFVPALVLMAATFASAQAGDWQKTYPVSGKASLTISTGDSSPGAALMRRIPRGEGSPGVAGPQAGRLIR